VELHPLLQQAELVAYCASQGIHVTAYAPLGSSDRPAFLKASDAPVLLDNPVIRSIAEAHDRSPAQVLIAWHVQRGISAVPKSVTPARLRENLAAAEIELTPAELERIAGLDRGLKCASEATFDLVLLDLHMPELDGFEVVRAIRERERTTGKHLPDPRPRVAPSRCPRDLAGVWGRRRDLRWPL
jgi:CheY-like chemotaxis protein